MCYTIYLRVFVIGELKMENRKRFKVLPVPSFWKGYLNSFLELEDVASKIVSLGPIFNRPGWYLDRMSKHSWVELPNGECFSWENSYSDFIDEIYWKSFTHIRKCEMNAIRILRKGGLLKKHLNLSRLLMLNEVYDESQITKRNTIKFMRSNM